MRVAELARQVGVRPDTVRYYERTGLLAPPPRTPSGYRQYPASAAERIRFIRDCQRLGLTLREIASLLAVRDTGECPCEPADELLQRHIAEIDAEMARLARLRSDLEAMVGRTDCPPWCPPEGR